MFTSSITFHEIKGFQVEMIDKVCVKRSCVDDTLFMTAIMLLYKRVETPLIYSDMHNRVVNCTFNADPKVYAFHWIGGFGGSFGNHDPDEFMKKHAELTKITKLPTHEKFISEKLNKKLFIRIAPNENTVVVMTDTIDTKTVHTVQLLIPKFFDIFEEKPLTEQEKTFLKTLTYTVGSHYIKAIRELVMEPEFKNFVMKDLLDAIEKKMFNKKKTAAEENLKLLEGQMTQALEHYRKACEKHHEVQMLVYGYNTMIEQKENSNTLRDYVMHNKAIYDFKINGDHISFIVKTYFAPHHVDEWDTISERGTIFGAFERTGFNKQDIKLLLDAFLSSNRCLKLKMCALFDLDYFGSTVTSMKHYDFSQNGQDIANCVPNPHLDIHNCFGQNMAAILQQLNDGEIDGAIECCIACSQRVNINEGYTFTPFIKGILDCNKKCFVTSDGIELTPKEAVEYLKGLNND